MNLFNFVFSKFQVYCVLCEDCRVDFKYFEIDQNSRLLGISAAGDGVLTELAKNPRVIDAIDLNLAHLSISALKCVFAKKSKSFDEFYHFILTGHDPSLFSRYGGVDQLFEFSGTGTLGLNIPREIPNWWRFRKRKLKKSLYQTGLTYLFIKMLGIALKFDPAAWLGMSYQERLDLFESTLHKLEKLPFFSAKMGGSVSLGISQHQASLIKSAHGGSFIRAIQHTYNRLCKYGLENPYLSMILHSQYSNLWHERHPNIGPLPFFEPNHYQAIRDSTTALTFWHCDIFQHLSRSKDGAYTHVNLADAIEWMDAESQKRLLAEIARVIELGGILLYRSVVKDNNLVERLGFTHKFDLMESVTNQASQEDQTCLYERIFFFRRIE